MIRLFRLFDGVRQRARRGRTQAHLSLGADAEDQAHRHLQSLGMIVVARNFRTRSGTAEADLIAWDAGTLVFVEVKSRRTGEFGAPDRNVDVEKRRKVTLAARDYTRKIEHPWERVRFDVVGIVVGHEPRLDHIRDAWRVHA